MTLPGGYQPYPYPGMFSDISVIVWHIVISAMGPVSNSTSYLRHVNNSIVNEILIQKMMLTFTLCVQEVRKIINESPLLSISIDESSNVSHQEISSNCIYTLESVAGVTSHVCHVLKMHQLPGAITTAPALLEALMSVLCGKSDSTTAHDGTDHHVAALSEEQLISKLVAAGGNGASVIQGCDDGLLTWLVPSHPIA
jgi:hypothetical protein